MEIFRLKTMLSGLGLELKGIGFRHGSMYATIKREFGLKGSKQKVYDQFKEYVDKRCAGIVQEHPVDGSNDT
ncbi:MAG TPA: hypothetical protein VNZ45_02565 [Bacteroidia bacterium]|nr:hypothetical protein [Bacteroidia bacterium]